MPAHTKIFSSGRRGGDGGALRDRDRAHNATTSHPARKMPRAASIHDRSSSTRGPGTIVMAETPKRASRLTSAQTKDVAKSVFTSAGSRRTPFQLMGETRFVKRTVDWEMGNVSDKVRVMKVIKVSGQWSRRRSEASAFAGLRRDELAGRAVVSCWGGAGLAWELFAGTPNSLRRATPRRTRVLPGTGGWHRFGPAGSAQGVDFPHIEKMSELYTRGNARSKPWSGKSAFTPSIVVSAAYVIFHGFRRFFTWFFTRKQHGFRGLRKNRVKFFFVGRMASP
jgi:hypothetical protein